MIVNPVSIEASAIILREGNNPASLKSDMGLLNDPELMAKVLELNKLVVQRIATQLGVEIDAEEQRKASGKAP